MTISTSIDLFFEYHIFSLGTHICSPLSVEKPFTHSITNNNILYIIFFQDIFPDKATDRKILSLAIRCPNVGCKWTGEVRLKEVMKPSSFSVSLSLKL